MKIKSLFALLFSSVIALLATHFVVLDHTTRTINAAIADSTQAANATVTRLLVNDIYPRLVNQLGLERAEPAKGLSGQALEDADKLIRIFIFGTDVMKVKIFGMNGITVYSTELSQIGQNQGTNPAFIAASQGSIGTQITHRGKFHSAEGEVYDRDLVSSYIPIRSKSGLIIGVAEIYTDRTPTLIKTRDSGSPVRPIAFLMHSIQLILLLFIGWIGWLLRKRTPIKP